MKAKFCFICLMVVGIMLPACKNQSDQIYGNELKAEKKLIANYIASNNINVIHTEPATPADWGENDYLEIADYTYYHLVDPGDTTGDPVAYRDYISLRYRKYSLDLYADTISAWNTNDAAYPVEFQYGTSSDYTCQGWLLAIAYMKYNNSIGKLICPSKKGFSEDTNSVTPYVYDLKIKFRK